MRTWTRAVVETRCGGPCQPGRIRVGEPMLVFEIAELKRRHVRCAHCAGEPVALDLPAVVLSARPARVEAMARLGLLPLVSREPGEEG